MSKNPSAPGTSSRFAGPARFIRDLPIWTKLGLIMIVPTLATIVVGTTGLMDQVEQASAAERARTLTVLSGDAGAVVHALQAERAAAVMLLSSPEGAIDSARATYTAQHEITQSAVTQFLTTWNTITDVPANFRAHLERIENQLGQLAPLRQQVTALNQVSLSVAQARYEELISDLLEIRTFSAQLTGDTSLSDRIRAAHAVATQKEFLARESLLIAKALVTGEYPTTERNAYVLAIQNARQAENEFRSVATSAQVDFYERLLTGAILRDVLQLEGSLDTLQPDERPGDVIDAAEWQRATTGRSEVLYQIESELNSQALRAAETLGASVQRRVLVETGILLLTLLIGVLFAWLVARSMARSLRDLRQGALAVAKFGLPQAVAKLKDPSLVANLSPAGVALQIAEPLPVRSNDEFGQVTEAFNAVHLEAVRTAAEQAALRAQVNQMFVNLARRSQILVDRLIAHLDRLERGEQDPDRLSELFQLDHLATRMRRNDENLLVLAGADSTRVQREPAALIDVLRAAQSEVEQYTRIEIGSVDQDIEVAAHAVNDLVHLIAELFDNATSFSPPDTMVRVEARRSGERVVLRIEDRGIGMTAEQYAELNERLASPPDVDVTVSRMMGLVVVSRLAARHGVTVTLQPAPQAGPQRGTVAEVVLPSGVLVPRALAGRAHSPTGFPAPRPEPVPAGPGQRSPFGPPLALESGPAGSPPAPSLGSPEPATTPAPAFGGGGGPSVGAPPAYGPPSYEPPAAPEPSLPPTPAPAIGAGAATTGAVAGGLGAALTSAGAVPPVGGGSNGRTGRIPAWYDLTGAPDPTHGPVTSPGGAEPLPQRRPGAWGDLTGQGPAATAPGPVAPPQPPPPPAWADPSAGAPAGFGAFNPPAPSAAPVPPAPPAPPPAPSAAPLPPPAPSAAPMPPPAAHPPAWPPTSDDSRGGLPDPAPSNDMTVELPIYSELESAWFASGKRVGPRPGAWPPDSSADNGTGDSSSTAESTEGGAERPTEAVSWRTAADEGWRAAQAAATPPDGGLTAAGLPRRIPMAQLVPGGVEATVGGGGSDRRTPDAVRGLLSAYHRGVQRGREAHGSVAPGPYSSGKEQEA